jgi:hypothetical protein
MVGSRAKGDQKFSVQTKSGKAVADAFFCLWYCCTNVLAKLLERSSLIIANGGKVLVDRLRFWE